jgi:hypothetical protein
MFVLALFGFGLSSAYLVHLGNKLFKWQKLINHDTVDDLSIAEGKIEGNVPNIKEVVVEENGRIILQSTNNILWRNLNIDRVVNKYQTRVIPVLIGTIVIPQIYTYLEETVYNVFTDTTKIQKCNLKNLTLRMNDGTEFCTKSDYFDCDPLEARPVLNELAVDIVHKATRYEFRQNSISSGDYVLAVGIRKGNEMKVKFIGNPHLVRSAVRRDIFHVPGSHIFASMVVLGISTAVLFSEYSKPRRYR